MTSKTGTIIALVCAAALGAEGWFYHLTHPNYPTTTFENDRVSIAYPAGWTKPDFSDGTKKYGLASLGIGNLGEPRAGFDTKWDTDPHLSMYITFWQPTGIKAADPREELIARYQKRHKRSFGADSLLPPGLQPARIAGLDGWSAIDPDEKDMIDIIMLPGSSFHPLKMLYSAVFGGEDATKDMLFRTKNGWVEIKYAIPGDKITRARYDHVFGQMLASLKIKDA